MSSELNNLLKQVLNTWLDTNIIENFFLFELYVKISKSLYNQNNCYNNLLKIIELLEKDYTIPRTPPKIKKWLEENKHNMLVYDIYHKLFNLLKV